MKNSEALWSCRQWENCKLL